MLNTVDTENKQKFRPAYPEGRDVVPFDEPPPAYIIWMRTLAVLPAMLRNPLEGFAQFHFELPVSRYKIFSTPFALISDPELIRYIFVERANDLEAEPLRQKLLRPALRDGLLTAEGDVWRNARKTIAPVFSPRNVNGFAQAMRSTIDDFLDEMEAGPDHILMSEAMAKATYLILSETLFSGDISGDSEAFLADTAFFLKHTSVPDPLDFMGAPEWMPRVTAMRGRKAAMRLRKTVRDTALRRQEAMEAGKDCPDDFLTLLLNAGQEDGQSLSLEEIEDNIITFIAAGHETTARALAWTLYLLSQDEDARQRAEAEADALDVDGLPPENWGEQLPWITACIEESLRLFPPAGMILRNLKTDIVHGEYDIPAGTTVYVSPWILHRHKSLWDDPATFDPERFYGDNRRKIERFEYLPFGLGPRICIGARFAMMEMQIVLATLLRHYRFDYAGKKEPWPMMKITIQADNHIPMTLSRRGQ